MMDRISLLPAMLIWTIVSYNVVSGQVPGEECPELCSCVLDIVTHCSSRNISTTDWLSQTRGYKLAKILHLGYNNIQCIQKKIFSGAGASVHTVFLQHNHIMQVHNEAFANMSKLSKLDLSHNDLKTLQTKCKSNCESPSSSCHPTNHFQYFFENLANSLENLILSHNKLRSLPNGAFRKMFNLKSLSLNNNRILWIAKRSFVGLDSLQELNLRHNPFAPITVRKMKIFIGSLSPLYTFRCAGRNCPNGLQRNTRIVDSVARILDLGGTRINDISGTHFPSSLHFLYLNDNLIPQLRRGVFDNLLLLTHLFLNGNQIRRIEANVFSNLTALKILDLSRNSISMIDSNALIGLNNLKSLRLFNNNKLSNISNELFHGLTSLRLVYLHNCNISEVPVGQWLFRTYALWLYGNPLRCSCGWILFYQLRSWKLNLDPYKNRTWGDFDTWLYQEERQSECAYENKKFLVKKVTRDDVGCTDMDVSVLLTNSFQRGGKRTLVYQYQNDAGLPDESLFDYYNSLTKPDTNYYYVGGDEGYPEYPLSYKMKPEDRKDDFSGYYHEEDYDLLGNFQADLDFQDDKNIDYFDDYRGDVFSGNYYYAFKNKELNI